MSNEANNKQTTPMRVRIKTLAWEEVNGPDGVWWTAKNPLGGLPVEALTEREKRDAQAGFERLVLSALIIEDEE